jgi:hypothetical protein
MSIPVEKLSEAAINAAVNLKTCVEAALPADISIYNVSVHLLTDDFSSVALHKQPQNMQILQPIISEC